MTYGDPPLFPVFMDYMPAEPVEVLPGMCPYSINGKITVAECRAAGQCGCDEQRMPEKQP
jgi:hypothetical protein